MAEPQKPDERIDGAPVDGHDEKHLRIRIPRRAPVPDVETTEIVRGAKPGTRYARRVRAASGASSAARTRAHSARRSGRRHRGRPRSAAGARSGASPSVRRSRRRKPKSSGSPRSRRWPSSHPTRCRPARTRRTKSCSCSPPPARRAHVLDSDRAGDRLLLAIVAFSYRQTIKAYPNGGGAYIVARENLGDVAGLTRRRIAGGRLRTDGGGLDRRRRAGDHVGVPGACRPSASRSRSAVVAVHHAAEPARHPRVRRRSLRIPTYGFIVSFVVLLIGGFVRFSIDPGLTAPNRRSAVHALGDRRR